MILMASCCLVGILLTLPFFLVSAEGASNPIVLKASAIAARNIPNSQGFEAWGREIEKRTNGQVKIEFYWAASLLKPADQMKGTGMGLADVSLAMPVYNPADTPMATIGELGYVTERVDAAARAMYDLFNTLPYFKNELERHNVKVMFFFPFPPPTMGSFSPIKTLEDLKGKKIRAVGTLNQVIAKLGATPVGIPLPEVYEALSRKIVDGYTGSPLSAAMGDKFNEVVKYYLDWGYGSYSIQYACFNKDKWDSLPADIRQVIEEVNKRGTDIYIDVYAKMEPDFIKPLKEGGCSFYTLPSQEVARWKSLVIPWMWDAWIERNSKYGPAKEFFDRFMDRVKYHEPRATYINPFPK
jgi:TRAP-type C4-dicarboxylate transport system substrate-binding protein